jgi:hypothetical protein
MLTALLKYHQILLRKFSVMVLRRKQKHSGVFYITVSVCSQKKAPLCLEYLTLLHWGKKKQASHKRITHTWLWIPTL